MDMLASCVSQFVEHEACWGVGEKNCDVFGLFLMAPGECPAQRET